MAAGILTAGPASTLLLLLLATLVACAGASKVTIPECPDQSANSVRLRKYPEDYDATQLMILNCSITKITAGDFNGLPNVTNIDLTFNDIAHIDTVAFRDVPQLQTVALSINKLRELPVFVKQSCPHLVGLYLQSNLLISITNGKTFAACTKLQYLYLSANRIEYLHPKVFSTLTDLKELYLGSNKLTFIPTFQNRKLKKLSLAANKLTYLPSDFLVSLGSRLDRFYIDSNPWHCACLLELLAEVEKVGVGNYKTNPYSNSVHFDGTHPECVFIGRYSCRRDPVSALLPTVRRK